MCSSSKLNNGIPRFVKRLIESGFDPSCRYYAIKRASYGTGYVGLVTGTCFAETGNDVICVDIDQESAFGHIEVV